MERTTPNRTTTIKGANNFMSPLNDPAIPYTILASLSAGKYLKRPLYLYDTMSFDPVLLTDTSSPYTLRDYAKFELFRTPIGQGNPPKTIMHTNMRTEGVVPESEVWVVSSLELQVLNSHRLNIWEHSELVWALSQGFLILQIDQENVLEIPANRAFVGAPPYIGEMSRLGTDTPGSWPDATNPHNSRMAQFGPTTGFVFFDSPIAFRPKVPFKVVYYGDEDALKHLAQWIRRVIPEEATQPFVHDMLKFRVALRGRRYINIERPL